VALGTAPDEFSQYFCTWLFYGVSKAKSPRPKLGALISLSRWQILLFHRFDLGVFATEALHTAGGIQQFLLAREEGVAAGADFYVDVALVSGTGGKAIAARAHDA
jgi:hypothetical protein